MRKLLLILILCPSLSFAQFSETINSDRPGQANGASTLGKNVFQIQSGYNLNTVKNGFSDMQNTNINNFFRFGLLERVELSALVNYASVKTKGLQSESSLSDFNDLQLGARFFLVENKGIIPALAVQSSVLFKLPNSLFPREKMGSNTIVATTNQISEWLSFNSNWIFLQEGNAPLHTSYVANISFTISERIGTFIEMYGAISNYFTTSFDAGFSYLINNDFQIDASAGIQDNSYTDTDYFIDLGISWRTNWRK
ncbi:MAG: transporter [Flavobacteriales bacterium]|nr:transporter [Flavobacteriales bacterium]